jgi:hypothetical protein
MQIAAAAPARRPQAPAAGPADAAPLPRGWWRALPRLHYVNFGGAHGLLPRVALDPRRPARQHLVAFEDAADADYVAGCLRDALAEGPAPVGVSSGGGDDAAAAVALQAAVRGGLRPRVVGSSPLLLEDVAALQGAEVDVLPRGRIRHGAGMGLEALAALLQEELVGGGGAGAGGGAGTPGAPRSPTPRAASPAAAAPELTNVSGPGSAVIGSGPAPPASGGFVPVSTDLPDLLLRSLQSLPGSMAAAAAAVAEVGATPPPQPRPQPQPQPQPRPQQPLSQQVEAAGAAEAEGSAEPWGSASPAGAKADLPGSAQVSGTGLEQAQAQLEQQPHERMGAGVGQAPGPSALSSMPPAEAASDSSGGVAPAPRVEAPTNAAMKRALGLLSPTFGKTPQEISAMQQVRLAGRCCVKC